jgi:hypothetical protein
MNKTTLIKLNEALQNKEAFIQQLKSMPDSKLSKHLDLFRQQMEMAYKQKNHVAYELLAEYEQQVFEARLLKFDEEQSK